MDTNNPESGMNPGALSAESTANPGTFSAESVTALLNQLSAQLGRNNGTSNPSIDQISPYFIHPSENPGWINLSLSSDISRSIMWNNLAYEIWSELRRRYYHGDRFRIAKLKEEFPKCSCGLGVIRSYRSEGCVVKFLRGLNDQFSTIRSQVMMMEPLPNLDSTFALLTQQERQLGFHGEESQILLNIAQHKSPQGTNSNKGSDSTKSDIVAANRQGRGKSRTYRGKGSGRGKIVCTYCGKLGHTIDVCYRKHGLPPHLKERYNSGGAATFNYAATDEHADEDSADQKQQRSDEQCLEFTQDQKIALLALLQRNELQSIHSTNQIVGQTPAMRGNTNQVIQLLHFKSHVLAERSGDETEKSKSWIIDIGATNHVSYYLQDFKTYHHIPTIIVKLPNGSYTTSNIIGTVRFSDLLYLTNTLYILSFNYKLISVSSLTSNLKCKLEIIDTMCEIQDSSKTRI
ncbi:uncharacterized protein LOC107641058 [Arachis ipaensis]|uniref:uncharacterized protein LOC107641058 n=1 Tax=Arachis ipaensis TaxID=130454 RepID=UPI0007AF6569|nr:uncharacterized protein LOC107641058 [Arachis ipaensis]